MNLLTNLFMSVLVTLQDTDVANLDVLVVTIILDILNIPRNDKRRILVLTKLCHVCLVGLLCARPLFSTIHRKITFLFILVVLFYKFRMLTCGIFRRSH